MTYQATTGAGNFAGLIQVLVISSFRYTNYFEGEKITVIGFAQFLLAPATSLQTNLQNILLLLHNQYSKITRKSFYVDESGIIRGGDINGAVATINETYNFIFAVIMKVVGKLVNLRTLIGAEYTFAATSGFGNYGSLSQLAQIL